MSARSEAAAAAVGVGAELVLVWLRRGLRVRCPADAIGTRISGGLLPAFATAGGEEGEVERLIFPAPPLPPLFPPSPSLPLPAVLRSIVVVVVVDCWLIAVPLPPAVKEETPWPLLSAANAKATAEELTLWAATFGPDPPTALGLWLRPLQAGGRAALSSSGTDNTGVPIRQCLSAIFVVAIAAVADGEE